MLKKNTITHFLLSFFVLLTVQVLNAQCTPPVINNLTPIEGPVNTEVTILGSGFTEGSGTTSVNFNGEEATDFTVLSNTEIKATVPEDAITGTITITTDGCTGISSDSYIVLEDNCESLQDLYISELYDNNGGSYGMIELYNPTNSTITFNGEYSLHRAGDVGGGFSYNLTLPGSVGPEETYLVQSGFGPGCTNTPDATMGMGINGNDEFFLRKNGANIDIARAPSNIGYTVIRNPDAEAPTTNYSNADWTFTSNNCNDMGMHTADPVGVASIVQHPQSAEVCIDGFATFTVALDDPTGFSYQWKILDDLGNWINLTDDDNYLGTNSSVLTIVDIPLSFDGNQYYCEVSLDSCILVSNAAQLTIASPDEAEVTVTQPTCTTPTGAITVISPLGADLMYSIDGINFQSDVVFSGLAPGVYNVTVQSGASCSSISDDIVIDPVPDAPDEAEVTVTQPTCATPTGTITITSPLGADLMYSIDGINFQSAVVFGGLTPGIYNVTVENGADCTSISDDIVIDPVPDAPDEAGVTVTQPTCTTPTGTITITSPLGADLMYSIDGINFQSDVAFSGLAPGIYNVTVQNGENCTSISDDIIIDPVPDAPDNAQATVIHPTCAVPTGTITVIAPIGTDLLYSIDGVNFQPEVTFDGLTPGTYNITVQNSDTNCTSISDDIIIDPVPDAPNNAQTTVIHPTCAVPTGTITVIAPIGTDLLYSIDGVNFQQEVTFDGLTSGVYNITVQNADGCTSISTDIVVDPIPDGPDNAQATVTHPTCVIPTGIITITSPLGSDLVYSIDGVNFQPEVTFDDLIPSTYNITVKNTVDECISISTDVVINPIPDAPDEAEVMVTPPTCTTHTGAITVTSPLGADLLYSIDGVNFQSNVLFNGLVPDTYNITVEDTNGCYSVSSDIVLEVVNTIEVETVQECRDVNLGKSYVLEVFSRNESFDINSTSFVWTDENGFQIGSNEPVFNVTDYVTSNNIDTADFPLIINVTLIVGGICEATTQFIVDSYLCIIPQGISPNNDGLNDSFDLTGFNVRKLSVHNRHGVEVYKKNNYKNEWYGQSKNESDLPTGTYFYLVETNSGETYTGWVYINR